MCARRAPAHGRPLSLCLRAKSVDEGCQRGRLLASARIVEEVAGERLGPVFEHRSSCTFARYGAACSSIRNVRPRPSIAARIGSRTRARPVFALSRWLKACNCGPEGDHLRGWDIAGRGRGHQKQDAEVPRSSRTAAYPAIRLFSLCFRSQAISERISRSSKFKVRCQAENPPSIVRLTPLM